MRIYIDTLDNFYRHVNQNIIADKVQERIGRRVSPSEEKAFRNSLPAVANALRNVNIPLDVEVAIEYSIPLTNRRIDFMMCGEDENGKDHIIICELKQWESVIHTDMEDVVKVGSEDHVHPSWQAYSYGTTISNFNEYVYSNNIEINPCAFLHNYRRRDINEICNDIYSEGIKKAKPFISDEYVDFANFIAKYIKCKSKSNLLYEIEKGKIKPSEMLANSLAGMLQGNKYYELIDQQRIVYSNLLKEIKDNQRKDNKQVFIIRGGAGTGKSVIAIQLLSSLIKDRGYNAFYVAKSSYVKENYVKQLTRNIPDFKFLRTLFMGSGSFMSSICNEFDVLLVDEAHRLTKKTKRGHLFLGENQIKEIIHASKTTVFFIDETQNVDIKDYGTIENIIKYAKEENASIHMDDKYVLKSQFRCSGSDEYIAWLEAILYNKQYVPSNEPVDYDIRIFDDLNEMKKEIVKRNNETNRTSRMLSGDVFPWLSMKDKNTIDIRIDNFSAQWNKKQNFATDPKSIDEVGCIHTSQGMEFEYVGLIVADDLYYEDGKIKTDYKKHPSSAGEFRRRHQKRVFEEDLDHIDRIIRNTYKVLFTRGQKGCYLYVMDKNLKEYLNQKINELKNINQ